MTIAKIIESIMIAFLQFNLPANRKNNKTEPNEKISLIICMKNRASTVIVNSDQ